MLYTLTFVTTLGKVIKNIQKAIKKVFGT